MASTLLHSPKSVCGLLESSGVRWVVLYSVRPSAEILESKTGITFSVQLSEVFLYLRQAVSLILPYAP